MSELSLVYFRQMTRPVLLLCALWVGTLSAQTLTTATIQRYFIPVRTNIEAAADAMPAAKYDFRLTADQMSFGEWLLHSADRNYGDCAALKGEVRPASSESINTLKGKEAIARVVKDSFSYCAAVLGALTDAKVTSTPELSYAFLHTVVHNNEIYGNLVGYLRVSGVVPPSTARRKAAVPDHTADKK